MITLLRKAAIWGLTAIAGTSSNAPNSGPRSGGFNPRQHYGQGGYDGGKFMPEEAGWNPYEQGPNAMAEASNFGRLKARTRHLAANNSIVNGALETHVTQVIGRDGIGCRADTGDEELNDRLNGLFAWAARGVDKNRRDSLRDSQALFYREFWSGECGVRWISTDYGDQRGVPAIELISDSRIDFHHTGQAENKNRIREGVEFDKEGRIVAYHVLTDDPTDNPSNGPINRGVWFPQADTVRVPADQMDLVFVKTRDLQIRGVPRIAPAIAASKQLQGFKHDTTIQARIATILAVFFSGDDGTDIGIPGGSDEPPLKDAAGNPITKLASGLVGFLSGKRKMETVTPSIPGPQYEPVVRSSMRDISRAARTSYADLSGDTSQANYSSIRAENNTLRTFYEQMMMVVWSRHTEPWRRRLIDWAIASGLVTLSAEMRQALRDPIDRERLYRCHVDLPPMPYVNPQQEANAYGEDIDNGVRSKPAVIRRLGGDPAAVIREQVAFDKALADEYAKVGLSPPAPTGPRVRPPAAPDEPPPRRDDDEADDPETLKFAGVK